MCVCTLSYPACISYLFSGLLYFLLRPVWLYHIPVHYLINSRNFGIDSFIQIVCFGFVNNFVGNISHCKKNSPDIIITVQLSMYSTAIVVGFQSDLNFVDTYLKNSQISNLMKIRPKGAELFHADRRRDAYTERQTDLMKLIVAFRYFCMRLKRDVTERQIV